MYFYSTIVLRFLFLAASVHTLTSSRCFQSVPSPRLLLSGGEHLEWLFISHVLATNMF